MPFDANSIQAVVIGDSVYVGGGLTESGNHGVVMVYSVGAESWRTLPPYESI